jgi:hypothetical protein
VRRICGRFCFSVHVSRPKSGLATFGSVHLFLHATTSVLARDFLAARSSRTDFCHRLFWILLLTIHHCSRGCPPLPHLLFLVNLQGSDFRADFCLACFSQEQFLLLGGFTSPKVRSWSVRLIDFPSVNWMSM